MRMDTKMVVYNGRVEVGASSCSKCYGRGTVSTKIVCSACNGTGRGKRGGRGSCRACSGMGSTWDQETRETCPQCQGINSQEAEQGTLYDRLPDDIWQPLTITVYRNVELKNATMARYYLEYGLRRNVPTLNDEQLIAESRGPNRPFVQAISVCREDGTLCDHVGIFVSGIEYKLLALFRDAEGNLTTRDGLIIIPAIRESA